MRKLSILVLIFALIFGTVGFAASDIESNLGKDLVEVAEGVRNTFEEYSNGLITRTEAVDRMQDYNAKTTFILKDARDNNASLKFIKLSAGMDIIIDLYRQGLDEMNIDKIKLANKIGTMVILPRLE